MKTLHLLPLALCSLLHLTACGDDDDDGGSSGSSLSPEEVAAGGCDQETNGSGDGNDCSAYSECAQRVCVPEYRACLGEGYEMGNFAGGACEAFMTCTADAPDPCMNDCTPDATCTECMLTLGQCVAGACSAELQECAGGATPAPSGSIGLGSGTCEDLEACCASLSGDEQTSCTQQFDSLQAGGDLACSAGLSIYQASGLCP